MSTDSLFGGSTDLTQTVDPESLALINEFLTDTVGGSAITVGFGDTTLVVGSGHDGEKQGALLPSKTGSIGTMDDGVLKLTLSMPAGLGFVFEGHDNATPDSVGTYLNTVVDNYLPAGTNDALREALSNAVADLVNGMKDAGVTQVVVRVVDFVSDNATPLADLRATSGKDVLFDAGASGGNELFAVNLGHFSTADTLVLKGVENAMVSGAGSVRIDSTAGVRITTDSADQNIIGGGGNDTLIGGGGHDTLTGGAGNDIFAFSHLGNFQITDFSAAAGDKVAFNVPGVTSVAQLLPLVTGVEETAQGVTYHFGPNASITLVGLSAHDVTADLIKFTF